MAIPTPLTIAGALSLTVIPKVCANHSKGMENSLKTIGLELANELTKKKNSFFQERSISFIAIEEGARISHS